MRYKLYSLTLVSVLITLFLAGCSNNSANSLTQIPAHALSARDLYPKAAELAASWKSDASLYRVHASVVNQWGIPEENYIEYRFESPNTQGSIFVVTCILQECAGILFDDVLTMLSDVFQSIEYDKILIDSDNANQIAVRSENIRCISQEDASYSLSLLWNKGGELEWLAYNSCSEFGTTYIRIDPFSGEITSIR